MRRLLAILFIVVVLGAAGCPGPEKKGGVNVDPTLPPRAPEIGPV